MSKVIFFNIPSQGHINPSLPVINELVRQGETVICINTEQARQQYTTTGAQFVAYPTIADLEQINQLASSGNIPRNALTLVQIAEQLMPWLLELLEREKPDYIIFDSLCSWAKQAAVKAGIRAAASISTYVLRRDSLPPMTPAMLFDTLRSTIPCLPEYQRTARRMRKAYGIKGVGLFGAVMNTGVFNIVYTSKLFQPGGDKFDGQYCFVGPSIAARPASNEFPFEQITGSPVVYISLGTINNTNVNFYHQCFEAFGDQPGQFILSAGKQTDLKALGAIPTNFIVQNFVPQLEVLQRSDLFITHGGMNSVSEGLFYGVPQVVIPQQVEQAVTARQVVKLGAGVALGAMPPYGATSTVELRAAVQHVLSQRDVFTAAAEKIGDSFREGGGYVRAAEALIAFGRGS
ncbi:MAG: glycosyltransferase [Anaerolineae bacterium]